MGLRVGVGKGKLQSACPSQAETVLTLSEVGRVGIEETKLLQASTDGVGVRVGCRLIQSSMLAEAPNSEMWEISLCDLKGGCVTCSFPWCPD